MEEKDEIGCQPVENKNKADDIPESIKEEIYTIINFLKNNKRLRQIGYRKQDIT